LNSAAWIPRTHKHETNAPRDPRFRDRITCVASQRTRARQQLDRTLGESQSLPRPGEQHQQLGYSL
jgi:hypothetical protein